MKVKYAFVTTILDEPEAIQNYIDAYESNGSIWDGTIDYDENITEDIIQTTNYVSDLGEAGYELILRNNATSFATVQHIYTPALIDYGLLAVIPTGSNYYREYKNDISDYYASIRCGAGDPEFGNSTGYPCIFFDKGNSEIYVDIVSIAQCGTPYKISHIRRASETILAVKLEGYVSDLNGTNIYEHGIPLNFGNLIGSDISPLPNGIKYTTYASEDANFFFISHDTTSGTINSGFNINDYQSVSDGTIQYGGTDTSEVFIINSSPTGGYVGVGITIKDITGFDNNPNGMFPIKVQDIQDGYYNKNKITHSLGDGTYGGYGKSLVATQSYSTPQIAGLLSDIKDSVAGDWTEAIGRAIVTSSNFPNVDTYDGYGYINVNDAKNYTNINYLRTPILTLEMEGHSIVLKWNIIPFANEYEIWFRNSLFSTIKENNVIYKFTLLNRYSKSPKNLFKVRAKKGNNYGEFSNQIEFPYYGAKFLKIK
jgi:hypothetical protein